MSHNASACSGAVTQVSLCHRGEVCFQAAVKHSSGSQWGGGVGGAACIQHRFFSVHHPFTDLAAERRWQTDNWATKCEIEDAPSGFCGSVLVSLESQNSKKGGKKDDGQETQITNTHTHTRLRHFFLCSSQSTASGP